MILVGEDGLEELEKVCWVLDACNVKINGKLWTACAHEC